MNQRRIAAAIAAGTMTMILGVGVASACTDSLSPHKAKKQRNHRVHSVPAANPVTTTTVIPQQSSTTSTTQIFPVTTAPATTTSSSTSTVVITPTTVPGTGSTSAWPLSSVSAESFGATGDGNADDTAALQKGLDSLKSGQALVLAGGKSYRHTQVLHVRVAGSGIVGPGTLLATNPQASSLWLEGAKTELQGMTVKFAANTARLTAPENHAIAIRHADGAVIRKVTVDGSAAAGIFMEGASNYILEDDTVQNTLADGIHNTDKSFNGQIIRPTLRNVGDDGVAVVSYISDGGLCHDITVVSPRLYGQTWGRGFAVTGGENVTFKDIYAQNPAGAGIYFGSEDGEYRTYGANNVQVLGGTIDGANHNTANDYGAILVSIQNNAPTNKNIDIENVTVTNTNSAASRQVGVISPTGTSNQRIQFKNITVTGGPGNVLSSAGTNANQFNEIGFKMNGTSIADHQGFTW